MKALKLLRNLYFPILVTISLINLLGLKDVFDIAAISATVLLSFAYGVSHGITERIK